jgi:hypothetical protein
VTGRLQDPRRITVAMAALTSRRSRIGLRRAAVCEWERRKLTLRLVHRTALAIRTGRAEERKKAIAPCPRKALGVMH